MISALIDLAPHEAKSLDRQEGTIEKGRKTFVEVGRALAKIRDGKLYRETHTTFEAYCQERWGWCENGQKSSETHYKNGEKHGSETVWTPEGKVIGSLCYRWENGVEVRR